MPDPTLPGGPTPKPAPRPFSLEGFAAEQANEAMAHGADPKATTDMLGLVVRHLRANPKVAQDAADAVARGADPVKIGQQVMQMAQRAPSQPDHPQLSTGGAFLSGAGQGATAGFADEALAGLDAINHVLPKVNLPIVGQVGEGAPLSTFGAQYRKTRDMIRASDAESANEHAIAHGAGVFLGGIAGARALPKLPGGIVGNGAAYGGLAGFGAGEGDASHQLMSAGVGAAAGAVLAPAVAKATPYVMGAAGSVANRLNLRPSDGTIPARIVKALGGQTVQDIARAKAGSVLPDDAGIQLRLNDPASVGKPITLLEIGGVQAQRALRGANVVSPTANASSAAALGQRAEEMPSRMLDDLYDAASSGDRTPATATISQMVEQRAKDATPEYQSMWAQHNQPITDPRFRELTSTPTGAKVWRDAKSALADKHIAVSTVQSQEMAPVTVPGKNGPVTLSNPDGSPILAPRKVQVEAPTPEQLHRAKLELDDEIKREYASVNKTPYGERGGTKTTRLRDLMGMRDQLVGILNDATQGRYNAVSAKYADDSQIIRAVEQGQDHFTRHPDETQQLVDAMPADAQAGYRRGAVDAGRQIIEGSRPQQLLRADAMQQQRIRQMFPNDASAAAFNARMGVENEMRGASNRVLVGSNTAEKLNDAGNVSAGAVVNAMTGRPGSVVRSVARGIVNSRTSAYNQRIAEALQPYLTAGATPDEMPLREALAQIQAQRAGIRTPSPFQGRLTAATAGRVTGQIAGSR